jgi:hypothetical protein
MSPSCPANGPGARTHQAPQPVPFQQERRVRETRPGPAVRTYDLLRHDGQPLTSGVDSELLVRALGGVVLGRLEEPVFYCVRPARNPQ